MESHNVCVITNFLRETLHSNDDCICMHLLHSLNKTMVDLKTAKSCTAVLERTRKLLEIMKCT